MRTLYLIRHGKSSWDDLSQDDMDRPLKKRGTRNAMEAGQLFASKGIMPDLLLTSPAVRAYETARIIAEALDVPDKQFLVNEALYMPSFSTLLKTILYTEPKVKTLFIVGHEPSISTIVDHFFEKPIEKIVTASVTEIQFDAKRWQDLQPGQVKSGRYYSRHDWSGLDLR